MMRSTMVIVFVCGSIALTAQNTVQPGPSAGYACPVMLHAQHGSDGNMLKVDRNRPEGPGQLLHVTLRNPDTRQIVKARVRVHGLSGKGRITQTGATTGDTDVVKDMEIRLASRGDKEASGDLWAADMTAVLAVELNAVTFDDGTSWQLARMRSCRFTPDPLMPVEGR